MTTEITQRLHEKHRDVLISPKSVPVLTSTFEHRERQLSIFHRNGLLLDGVMGNEGFLAFIRVDEALADIQGTMSHSQGGIGKELLIFKKVVLTPKGLETKSFTINTGNSGEVQYLRNVHSTLQQILEDDKDNKYRVNALLEGILR